MQADPAPSPTPKARIKTPPRSSPGLKNSVGSLRGDLGGPQMVIEDIGQLGNGLPAETAIGGEPESRKIFLHRSVEQSHWIASSLGGIFSTILAISARHPRPCRRRRMIRGGNGHSPTDGSASHATANGHWHRLPEPTPLRLAQGPGQRDAAGRGAAAGQYLWPPQEKQTNRKPREGSKL